jgi:hypothetical protein
MQKIKTFFANGWVITAIVIAALAIFFDYQSKVAKEAKVAKAAAKEVACQASPACLAQRADRETAKRSRGDRTKQYVSATGKLFYNGYDCVGDCNEYKRGFDWAQKLSISNEDVCDRDSVAFTAGCTKAVSDIVYAIEENGKENQSDDRESEEGTCSGRGC